MSGLNGIVSNALAINGVNVKGTIRELKDGVSIGQAFEAGSKDGLDQVYIEAGGKKYVVQGDGLDLSGFKKSDLPVARLYIDGKGQEAEFKAVDNEKNTAKEGWWNLGTKLGVGVAAFGVVALFSGSSKSGEAAMGAAMGGFAIIAGGGLLTVGSAAVGAGYRSFSGEKPEKLASLLK
ncbi:MAG: hypothetical protein ACAI44_15625 [Candidatus Sericytochromatia bacterium]